jgi:methionine-S-sulfoxide reductase
MDKLLVIFVFVMAAIGLFIFSGQGIASDKGEKLMDTKPKGYPVAILAGGCFWCTESEYRALDGVLYTRVGYIGGHLDNPTYDDTHDSKSGHAEAVEVTFDPAKISYADLVEFFLTKAHDPTQLNRQGPDVGTQYRSAIFPTDEAQEKTAREMIAKVDASGLYDSPIVTTIEPIATFWEAEGYHQQYYEKYEEKTGRPHLKEVLKKMK